MQGFKTMSSQLGMNFLLLLFFRLFLSWPPAGKVVSKKARDAGRGCGECPVNGSPSFPGRSHAHSIPTFCFILLAALRLPVLGEAREDECVLELILFSKTRSLSGSEIIIWGSHMIRDPSVPSQFCISQFCISLRKILKTAPVQSVHQTLPH